MKGDYHNSSSHYPASGKCPGKPVTSGADFMAAVAAHAPKAKAKKQKMTKGY